MGKTYFSDDETGKISHGRGTEGDQSDKRKYYSGMKSLDKGTKSTRTVYNYFVLLVALLVSALYLLRVHEVNLSIPVKRKANVLIENYLY